MTETETTETRARPGATLGVILPLARAAAVGVFAALAACGGGGTPAATTATPADGLTRRPVAPVVDGAPVRAGISYGPFREGQAPGGASPTEAQILEDLRILAPRWHMIRVYSALGPTETILRLIREHDLPIRVMLGAWIHAERPAGEGDAAPDPAKVAANEREVDEAVRLANAYEDVVFAVCVGNETQVFWSGHRTRQERLVELIRRARASVTQPVATADDYNFWNKPESQAVAAEIDFLVLHAYAMWNRQTLEDAVPWTATQVQAIRGLHPDLAVFLGETGWATVLHASGDAATQIVAPAGEAEQARFFQEFTAWAAEDGLPYFYFEAFDEPWKGGPHPDEIEKHWGLYRVDRTPKPAIADAAAP